MGASWVRIKHDRAAFFRHFLHLMVIIAPHFFVALTLHRSTARSHSYRARGLQAVRLSQLPPRMPLFKRPLLPLGGRTKIIPLLIRA
jgi:hypothetical protein